MVIIFSNISLSNAESLVYDNMTDRINIQFLVDDVTALSKVVLDPEKTNDIHTETDTFKGYNKITTFFSQYDISEGKHRCYLTLEKDETTYEKLIKRISELETAKTELVNDVRNLQRVNLVDLVKEKLIPDDLASALTIADKQIVAQVSLKDPDGKIVMEGDISK